MDLSASTNMRSKVQIPATPSMLFPFIVKFCVIFNRHCVEKMTKITKKSPGLPRLKYQSIISGKG